MRKQLAMVVAVACLVAACSSTKKATSDTRTGSVKTSSATVVKGGGSGSGSGAAGGACKGFTAGKDGVIRLWCGGSARVTFNIGGAQGEIDGGTCDTSGGYFSVNAGVTVGLDFKGKKPDYAGFVLPLKSGPFTAGTVAVAINSGGVGNAVLHISGSHDARSGSLKGRTLLGKVVSASFTC